MPGLSFPILTGMSVSQGASQGSEERTRSQLGGACPRESHTNGTTEVVPGASGLEPFMDGVAGRAAGLLDLRALTWRTCYARLSPGPGGPAHTGQNRE